MKKKAHIQYRNSLGEIIPGVTSILGDVLSKPALIHWAWNLGMKGEDYRKTRDIAASIGTIAHLLCEYDLKGEKPDLSDFTPNDVDKAETAFLAFLDFKNLHNLVPKLLEIPLVSELGYGGTIDCYCELDGKLTLLDFKTSSGVFPEMRLQVAAYKNLLQEHKYAVEQTRLLRIDKETGEFNYHSLDTLDKEWEMFKLLIPVYNLKKELWKK